MTKYLHNKYLVFIFFLLVISIILGLVFLKTNLTSQPQIMSLWRLCDLDHNGNCDNKDQQIFDKTYGKCREDTGYNFNADIDGDGCIVSADKNSFTISLEEK